MGGFYKIRFALASENTTTVHSLKRRSDLRALSADAASELNVLGYNGHVLGVYDTQVGILKETNEVSLCSLMKGKDGRSLKAKVALEVLGDLADEALEQKLADEEVG